MNVSKLDSLKSMMEFIWDNAPSVTVPQVVIGLGSIYIVSKVASCVFGSCCGSDKKKQRKSVKSDLQEEDELTKMFNNAVNGNQRVETVVLSPEKHEKEIADAAQKLLPRGETITGYRSLKHIKDENLRAITTNQGSYLLLIVGSPGTNENAFRSLEGFAKKSYEVCLGPKVIGSDQSQNIILVTDDVDAYTFAMTMNKMRPKTWEDSSVLGE